MKVVNEFFQMGFKLFKIIFSELCKFGGKALYADGEDAVADQHVHAEKNCKPESQKKNDEMSFVVFFMVLLISFPDFHEKLPMFLKGITFGIIDDPRIIFHRIFVNFYYRFHVEFLLGIFSHN